MSDPRTLKVQAPHMKGPDVQMWQRTLLMVFKAWKVGHPLRDDGDYGVGTRDATAAVLYGLGISQHAMAKGVTPELRIKVRSVLGKPSEDQRTKAERERSRKRAGWRKELRQRFNIGSHVAPPLAKILASSWGWHPGVHDGVDLICLPNATIYALCDAEVFDVRTGGWWGKAPSGDVTKGDGIIQIRCLTDVGPFKRGMHFGYGHAEHPVVREGQRVRAGEPLGKAGLAVAWHVHFMASGGGTTKGIGDRDPMPFVRFALKH